MGARDESEPELPLRLGPVSNGEFVPGIPNLTDRLAAAEAMARSLAAADRLGVDRRRFLQGAGGMAALLGVLNLAACSDGGSSPRAAPRTSAPTTGGTTTTTPATSGPGGTFTVPPTTDLPACEHVLGSQGEFIFDVHTHHVIPDGPWRHNAPDTLRLVLDMLPPDCSATDRVTCADRAAYLHDIFLGSDTTVALLTDVPNDGPDTAPIPFADAEATQDLVAQLAHGGASRLLLHDVIAPNVGDLQARLEDMTVRAETRRVAGFKVYTAWSPDDTGGYSLDDPKIGLPVLQHAHDLGLRVFCAHKGLPLVNFDPTHNGPRDMVAASRIFPDMQFVIFHSAWDPNHVEGPYDPGDATRGVDSVLKALDDYKVAPNSNVWVDIATLWRTLLSKPTQASHALGKVLKRVGTNRVLWGTDAIWYGSPQPQIMAFRAFEITPEFQEAYGYPALTPEVKAGIFGLNAANLFGLDPTATRCALADDIISDSGDEHADLVAAGALGDQWRPRGPVTRREMINWLVSPGTHWTPS